VTIKADHLSALPDAAGAILDRLDGRRVVAFYGAMGAGKTTLIRAMCERLGVTDNVNSPTFSIVNEYRTAAGERVFHFDFYRIERAEEALDMGCEEYFYSGDLCLVEWPERIEGLLPNDTARVRIEITGTESRTIAWE